ncbi:hypothetical protein RHCH11_RHCH11_00920 [Beijerinckiaceae bacterium RH CH11]|nr:hypothetical protein RHCH11_RHCH11_00920 [Beijerinckiaceae bacterium RH CH11]
MPIIPISGAIIAAAPAPVPPTLMFIEPPTSVVAFWPMVVDWFWPIELDSFAAIEVVALLVTLVVWSFDALKNWFSPPVASSKVISLLPEDLYDFERKTMRVLLSGSV